MRKGDSRRVCTCSACGGEWFREASYYAFLPEEGLGSWDTWPDLTGQGSWIPMTVGVCLCGTRQPPNIGGVRGGRTPNLRLTNFLASLERAQQEALPGLVQRLKRTERAVGKQMNPGRGRPWEMPQREPASQGRDTLVVALQRRGLTVRKARAAVKAFWEILAQGLRSRYVETPLGIFDLVRRIPRKRQRWGREQALYTQSRIRFRPSRQLVAACNPQLKPKESPVCQRRNKTPAFLPVLPTAVTAASAGTR
jgi:hypothetical protein